MLYYDQIETGYPINAEMYQTKDYFDRHLPPTMIRLRDSAVYNYYLWM